MMKNPCNNCQARNIGKPTPKYVIFKKGKTIYLAEKGAVEETLNNGTVQKIIADDDVFILSNGMSRVQIARISKALNNRNAKITIVKE